MSAPFEAWSTEEPPTAGYTAAAMKLLFVAACTLIVVGLYLAVSLGGDQCDRYAAEAQIHIDQSTIYLNAADRTTDQVARGNYLDLAEIEWRAADTIVRRMRAIGC